VTAIPPARLSRHRSIADRTSHWHVLTFFPSLACPYLLPVIGMSLPSSIVRAQNRPTLAGPALSLAGWTSSVASWLDQLSRWRLSLVRCHLARGPVEDVWARRGGIATLP
jgi:hypothetical protein